MRHLILLCLISLAIAAPLFRQHEEVEKHLSVKTILNSNRSPRDLRRRRYKISQFVITSV